MTQQQLDFINAMLTKDAPLILEKLELVGNIQFSIRTKSGIPVRPMHLAAQFGLNPVLEELISRGAKVDEQNSDGCTPLHLAQAKGHIDCAKYLLTIDPTLIVKGDANSATPLHFACQTENLDFLQLYLNLNRIRIDLNEVRDNEGATPLHWAARDGNFEAVQYLIERGAKASVVDKVNQTPSQYSSPWGRNKKMFQFLRSKEIPSLFEICSFKVEKLPPESRTCLPQVVASQQEKAAAFVQNFQQQKIANQPNIERQTEQLRNEFERLKL